MEYIKFSKKPENFPDLSVRVATIAERLKEYMESDLIRSAIGVANKLNGTSQQIQSLLEEQLLKFGFKSERKNLFKEYKVPSLRPDFYLDVGESGILVEVERGKTIANNMDLLDIWKCHLCSKADFLFLVVPCERRNYNGQVTRAFDRASKRMATFFEPTKNYVNVEAVHLFGY